MNELIKVIGLVYLVFFFFYQNNLNEYYPLQQNNFTSFHYWKYPLIYFLLPQLLWIKKINKSVIFRVLLLILLLFALFYFDVYLINGLKTQPVNEGSIIFANELILKRIIESTFGVLLVGLYVYLRIKYSKNVVQQHRV